MATIFLDNNATTRVDDRVIDAMLPYFSKQYANADSSHLFGLTIKETVETAQEQLAALIGSKPNEIVFTSGATESINLALKGLFNGSRKHLITISSEHKAVLDCCHYLQENACKLSIIPTDNEGNIDLLQLENLISEDTLAVCVMLANNETGHIHPIRKIAALAHQKGALLICDATQAIGKIAVDVRDLGIDLMPLSAHKFYGPKGIGALFVTSKTRKFLNPVIHGGGHQHKLRSGTLNVPGIVGMGKAAEIALAEMEAEQLRIKILRDRLETGLLQIEGSFVNGNRTNRLNNTTNICFPGIVAEQLILALNNIAVSNGSACAAVTSQPSHVLKALGLSDQDALASVRFSLGRFNTEQEIDRVIEIVSEKVTAIRQTVSHY